jgi:hypothetical protein
MTPEEKKERAKLYYEANKERIKEKNKLHSKQYYQVNKDKLKKYREVNKDKLKKYREVNKDKINQQKKEYVKTNKDKIKEQAKQYYETNKNKIKEQAKQQNKKYREVNKHKINEYQKNRKLNDPLFKLTCNIRSLISVSIKRNGFKKTSKTFLILGCSFAEFKQHLESKFESWMTWDNYGLYNGLANYGWDIDHIIPSSRAITEEDAIKLNHYTNLKPLCSYNNRVLKKAK